MDAARGEEQSDKHEKLKEARKEVEEKKIKILQLIKGEEQDGSNAESDSLETMVKDYHKQYDSLYELYHNLMGEWKKKVHGKNESSSSDSDSEVDHSSKGKNVELNQRVEELKREKDSLIRRAEEAEASVVELKGTVDGLQSETKELTLELAGSTILKGKQTSRTPFLRIYNEASKC